MFTTSVWTDSELSSLRGQLEEAKLNGQAAEKEMDAEGENPMTILKYNQVPNAHSFKILFFLNCD